MKSADCWCAWGSRPCQGSSLPRLPERPFRTLARRQPSEILSAAVEPTAVRRSVSVFRLPESRWVPALPAKFALIPSTAFRLEKVRAGEQAADSDLTS